MYCPVLWLAFVVSSNIVLCNQCNQNGYRTLLSLPGSSPCLLAGSPSPRPTRDPTRLKINSPVRTEIRPRLGERREFPKIRRVSTKSELSWRPRRRRGGEARRRSRGDGKSGRRGARRERRDPLRAVATRLFEKSAHGRHDSARRSFLGDLKREIYSGGLWSPSRRTLLFSASNAAG